MSGGDRERGREGGNEGGGKNERTIQTKQIHRHARQHLWQISLDFFKLALGNGARTLMVTEAAFITVSLYC